MTTRQLHRGCNPVRMLAIIILAALSVIFQSPILDSGRLSKPTIQTMDAKSPPPRKMAPADDGQSSDDNTIILQYHGPQNQFFEFCNTTTRCVPIDKQKNRISYVHISKNAGVSWILEFRRLLQDSDEDFKLYPTSTSGQEHSVLYQDEMLNRRPGTSWRFLTLRSPRHHMWSLFSHCYYSEWGHATTRNINFPRHHSNDDILIDFREWLQHFANDTSIHTHVKSAFRCYHPANYQSRALVVNDKNPHGVVDGIMGEESFDMNVVYNTYWSLDWVSLTAFFRESKCLLYYRLSLGLLKMEGTTTNNTTSKTNGTRHRQQQLIQDYLDYSCQCDKEQNSTSTSLVSNNNITSSLVGVSVGGTSCTVRSYFTSMGPRTEISECQRLQIIPLLPIIHDAWKDS